MQRYGPYKSNGGHLFFIDIDDQDNRESIFVHREVVEKHLGRKLNKSEVVHHIDEDKENNDISNLEITSSSAHSRMHRKKGETIELVCVFCGVKFERNAAVERRNRKTKRGPFCGRSCTGKYGKAIQLGGMV